ncbi:MAG: hypothetical protein ABSG43_21275 [Solirubrobacteraceae bacterium]|jgi:hypothetical protein
MLGRAPSDAPATTFDVLTGAADVAGAIIRDVVPGRATAKQAGDGLESS